MSAQLQRAAAFLDGGRRVLLNALFWGALVALLVLAWRSRPRVPDGAALVLDPEGLLVEELSADSRGMLARELTGQPTVPAETLLRDVLDALRLAADDPRVHALVLDVDGVSGGLSKLREVGEAVSAFKARGKKVVSYSERLGDAPYYLAARADEVMLHPDGLFVLDGFGGYRPYFKEGLDRFGVRVHVFRVGQYKSAVEPYTRGDMSPEAKEAAREVYDDLWRTWLEDVASARGLAPASLRDAVAEWPRRVKEAGGDLARTALEAGLVDELVPRDRLRARMIELVGSDDEGRTYRRVGFRTYLAARATARGARGRGEGVAVVVARGEILDGSQPPGTIGGDSTAALLRRAREDERARAVVFRVDSPGGSAFASEVIRRECELVRAAGKPLVVSMSSVAASGGYWIATAADEIWASPATITGSIGIFGMFPDLHEGLDRHLGVHFDGVGTTPWTDALNPGRPLDPTVAALIQDVIDRGYEDFLQRVATARSMTRDEVDAVARGRIWSGEDALARGLVDSLGDLEQAIASAAGRAGLAEGYRVFYVERPPSLRVRLARALLGSLPARADPDRSGSPAPIDRAIDGIRGELSRLARWNDPRGAYAHCLCGEERP